MYLYLKSPILRRLLTINKKLRISKSATYLIHCKLVIVYQHRACFRVKNTQSQESTIILSSYYYYYYSYLLLEAKKQNKSPPYVNSICIHLKIREKKNNFVYLWYLIRCLSKVTENFYMYSIFRLCW